MGIVAPRPSSFSLFWLLDHNEANSLVFWLPALSPETSVTPTMPEHQGQACTTRLTAEAVGNVFPYHEMVAILSMWWKADAHN